MPLARFYENGMTLGMGGNPNPVGGKRGEVIGWTPSAVRRHTRWLYSIKTKELTGHGYAVTLTLRDTPETHEDWARLRKTYLDALRASGVLLRAHWVVEWQKRGTPHMHLAIYLTQQLEEVALEKLLIGAWISRAGSYGAKPASQHLARISGVLGWIEYLSKHAARGVAHYQRSGKPRGWEKTGRLWGHVGEWPEGEPLDAQLTREQLFRFRRLVRSWRVADARAGLSAGGNRSAARRVASARRMLKSNDRTLSQVRGVSEFISEAVGLRLLEVAAAEATAAKPAGPARLALAA